MMFSNVLLGSRIQWSGSCLVLGSVEDWKSNSLEVTLLWDKHPNSGESSTSFFAVNALVHGSKFTLDRKQNPLPLWELKSKEESKARRCYFLHGLNPSLPK